MTVDFENTGSALRQLFTTATTTLLYYSTGATTTWSGWGIAGGRLHVRVTGSR